MPDRTLRNIAETCLDYIETADASTPLASATVPQQRVIAQQITGAMQELFRKKPEAFGGQQGATLGIPVTGNAVVTAGSTTIDVSALGIDCRGKTIESGSIRNQIAAAASSPGTALVEPWTGTTGTHAIKVYNDAILISSSFFNVVGAVMLQGFGPLKPLPDRASYIAYRDAVYNGDYGTGSARSMVGQNYDQPVAWWAESAFIANSSVQTYLRIAPIPSQQVWSISYTLEYRPRVIQIGDLIDNAITLPVPGDFYDSILIPWVLQRWTGSPWFRNDSARAEIGRQFAVAQEILRGWGPSEQADTQLIVPIY